MNDHTAHIDAEQVKKAAAGRELELLEYVGHIDRELLDGKPHPCPRPGCGGKDRFRMIDAKAGAVYCNQCFNSKNGDFLAAIQHFRGISFPQALQESAYRLGLTSSLDGGNGRPRKASQEGSPPATDPLIRMAEVKRCPVESLRTYGATSFPTQRAVGFPMFDANGAKCSQFDIWPDATDDVHRKGMNQKGKPTGVFLPIENGDPRLPAVGETWLIVEGVKDASAAHGLGLLAVGLPGKSIKREWLEMFRGVNVLICLDNDEAGREAAPKAAKALQGVAAIARIVTLPQPGDLRDNLAVEGGEQAVRDAIEQAGQEGEPTEPPAFPPVRSYKELATDFPALREPVIHGLLRNGETLNIVSLSKYGKSWLIDDLALAVTTGRRWLDSFDVEQGAVLICDNELHENTIRYRIKAVADKRDITEAEYADRLHIVSFRGRLRDIFELESFFWNIEPGRFKLLMIDAIYRFLGEKIDENSNADMARFYNQVDKYAGHLGCAVAGVHHATKGSQAGKSVTDVGSGAGAQSRAADTHLILRPHAEDGAVVLEAVCRSFPPVEPRVLRWEWPVWNLASDLDPTLRPEKSPRANRDAEIAVMYDRILQTFIHFPDGASKTDVRKRVGQGKAFDAAWFKATNGGDLEEVEIVKGNRQKYKCWKRVYREKDNSDN